MFNLTLSGRHAYVSMIVWLLVRLDARLHVLRKA